MELPHSQSKPVNNWIYKIILGVLCTVFLVMIFPKEGKFKYEFQKGAPWRHEALMAPFDFAILKSEESLETERNNISQNIRFYFSFKEDIGESKISEFTANVEERGEELNKKGKRGFFKNLFNAKDTTEKLGPVALKYLNSGRDILGYLYRRGIVKLPGDLPFIKEKKNEDVMVVKGKVRTLVPVNNLFTLQTAYNYASSRVDGVEGIDKDLLKEMIRDQISHNIFYDLKSTDEILEKQLTGITQTRGKVVKDQKIIDRGEVINAEMYQMLVSLKQEYEQQIGGSAHYYTIMFGQFILITLMLGVLMTFLFLLRKDIFYENNKVLFLFLLICLMAFMSVISSNIQEISIYILPFCILPIILRTFYDIGLASFVHLISIILIGFLAANSFEFVLVQFCAGMVAIFTLVNLRKRSQLFVTAFYIFLSYSVTYVGMNLIQEGNFLSLEWSKFGYFGASAALTLFAYPLMYAFEKIFGFLSDVSLLEISDTNSPLLRQLAEKAPGTFQHSMQVANLAEEVIFHIGGNALLIRTGALYHDIGKMKNPAFFIENQQGANPHDQITSEESARVIINHVKDGLEMAKEHKLPHQIIDFIQTHHGTTRTEYFYALEIKEKGVENVNPQFYTYPGPIPSTKEMAVLMMADSVEAASRSLKQPSSENLETLVDKIIDHQATANQFVNSNITFRDISEIKLIFKRKLKNIYHERIEYPSSSTSPSPEPPSKNKQSSLPDKE